jgi:hypothetical protein
MKFFTPEFFSSRIDLLLFKNLLQPALINKAVKQQ